MSAADLRRALKRVDAALAEAARLRQAHPEDASAARHRAEARAELERAVAACESLPAGLARRVEAARARLALHDRAVPPGALDGLYAAVRAGADADPWGRAGMSGAFLDAPRALARWRTAALAACVLLAVGAVVLGRADVPGDAPTDERPLQDPREGLLERWDGAAAADGGARAPWREGSIREVGVPADGGAAGDPWRTDPWRTDRGRHGRGGPRRNAHDDVVLFHWQRDGGGRRLEIEAGEMLDAAGGRLRVRVLPAPSRDERESN